MVHFVQLFIRIGECCALCFIMYCSSRGSRVLSALQNSFKFHYMREYLFNFLFRRSKKTYAIMLDEFDALSFLLFIHTIVALNAKYIWVAQTIFTTKDAADACDESPFCLEYKCLYLHILFRNSQHISMMNHGSLKVGDKYHFPRRNIKNDLYHIGKVVAGCFQSTQEKIQVKYIKSLPECKEIAKDTDFLNPKFRSDRLVLIYTSKSVKQTESKEVSDMQSFIGQNWNADGRYVIIYIDRRLAKPEEKFSGTECKSVLVVWDEFLLDATETWIHYQIGPILMRAVSRAQLEVGLIVPESFKKNDKWLDYLSTANEKSVQSEFYKFRIKDETLSKNWLHPSVRSEADYEWIARTFSFEHTFWSREKTWVTRHAIELAAVAGMSIWFVETIDRKEEFGIMIFLNGEEYVYQNCQGLIFFFLKIKYDTV